VWHTSPTRDKQKGHNIISENLISSLRFSYRYINNSCSQIQKGDKSKKQEKAYLGS